MWRCISVFIAIFWLNGTKGIDGHKMMKSGNFSGKVGVKEQLGGGGDGIKEGNGMSCGDGGCYCMRGQAAATGYATPHGLRANRDSGIWGGYR
jgi:hypothetical protein